MSLPRMGLPIKDDDAGKNDMDAMALVADHDTTETNGKGNNNSIDFGVNREESYFELWPIEHPIEPDPHEDRPVHCPLPHSSIIKEERVCFGTRRKRHHTLSHNQDHHIKTIPFPPPPPPPPTFNIYSNDNNKNPFPPHSADRMFQMLQQLNNGD